MYGYMMPETEYDEDRDDGLDMEEEWFKAHGPERIKALDLSREEHVAWNALPYFCGWGADKRTPQQKAAYEDFEARYSIYSAARRTWLKMYPVPADTQYVGSYESEELFLALCGPDGRRLTVWANWAAVPVDFGDPLFVVDQQKAKNTLDSFLRDIGIEPPEDLPQWHLIPCYG